MSERALDVLTFIGRVMEPETPLTVDILKRNFTAREMRNLSAQRRYLELKLAELTAYRDLLSAIIRYKDVTEGAPSAVEATPTVVANRGGQHGTARSYGRGCRCDRCRDAIREYHRDYRRRKAGAIA